MKNTLPFLLLAFALLLTSCFFKSDPCEGITCNGNGECEDGTCTCEAGWAGEDCSVRVCIPSCVNGTCVDGVCQCDAGYEGAACDVRQTAKFVGNHNVSEDCASVDIAYTCEIQEMASVQWIRFTNLHDFVGDWGITTPISATVDGSNIHIPDQIVTNGTNSFLVDGTGFRNSTGVVYVYFNFSKDGGFTQSCTLTMLPL